MELACQLERMGARLAMEWCPREGNEEADRLSNGDLTGFDPARRVKLEPNELEWIVLDRFMTLGMEFAEDRGAVQHQAGRAAKRRRLREFEPW